MFVSGRPAPGGASSCTASYGTELATTGNCCDAGGSEADATTGFSSQGSPPVLDSITTDPYSGTYHLHVTADGAGDGVYRHFSGLSASTVYKFSVRAKETGATDWPCYLAWGNYGTNIKLPETTTSWEEKAIYFHYAASSIQTFVCKAGGDGLYLDSFSIKTATLCYGSELFTNENAASKSNEANSVGSWTATGYSAFEVVTTDPQDGTYHLHFTANANSGNFTIDLNGLMTAGDKYFASWKVKGVSGDPAYCGFANTAQLVSATTSAPTTSSWTNPGFSFTYSSLYRYFTCKENGSSNNSELYFDSLSIKKITAE